MLRYQYLMLAFAARHGREYEASDGNLGIVIDHNWTDFYRKTNEMLQPSELCDCYRSSVAGHTHEIVENRFYVDDRANVRLSYLQVFGRHPWVGTWLPGSPDSWRTPHKTYEPKWKLTVPDMLKGMHVATACSAPNLSLTDLFRLSFP